MSWQNALILEKNEKVIRFWKSDYEAQTTAMKETWLGERLKTVKQKRKGILVLTNQKLVWIEEMGIFGKSYHPLVTIRFENIEGILIGETISKYISAPACTRVSIVDRSGEYIFYMMDPSVVNQDDLNFFKRIVLDQVDARKQELVAEKRR